MSSALELARKVGRGAVHRLINRAYGRYHLYRFRRAGPAHFGGLQFQTDPEVLHPIYFRSTRVMIDRIRTLDLTGKAFLDMGSGSGAIGIFAAARGARVTACDVNPKAVDLTRANFALNGVKGEVFESDLFQALGGRAFDLIGFNIPFYEGVPRTPFEAALFGGPGLATVAAFARGCREALAPHGQLLVVFSEQADRDKILSLFAEAGWAVADETVARRLWERFHLLTFRLRELGRS